MTVFLPCGVTQAMMVLAINSGSPATGAATLFTFTLATSPLFFMLGFFATKLGDIMHSRFTKFAAVGIAAIALLTLDAGLRLANSPVTLASIKNSILAGSKPVPAEIASDGIQEARIQAGAGGYSPGNDQHRRRQARTTRLRRRGGPLHTVARVPGRTHPDTGRDDRRRPATGHRGDPLQLRDGHVRRKDRDRGREGGAGLMKEKLKVSGMHCGSCAMNIDEQLEELDGVSEAKTSYRKQVTEVIFDETRIDLDRIQKAISSLGYEASRA